MTTDERGPDKPSPNNRGLDKHRAVQTLALDAAGKILRVGSGYLLSADLVLTAEHVIRGAASVSVRIVDAPGRVRAVPAKEVEFADGGVDVAVVRLDIAEPAPVGLGNTNELVAWAHAASGRLAGILARCSCLSRTV